MCSTIGVQLLPLLYTCMCFLRWKVLNYYNPRGNSKEVRLRIEIDPMAQQKSVGILVSDFQFFKFFFSFLTVKKS